MRQVLICPACNLNQFRCTNGRCRRCKSLVDPPPLPLPIVPKADPEPKWQIANFGESLYFWRSLLGISQMGLSRKMGRKNAHGTISRIEAVVKNAKGQRSCTLG